MTYPNESKVKTEKKYSGVIVPMITPFTSDGKVDEAAVEKILQHFIEADVSAFILGTTGEASSVPEPEKIRFVEFTTKNFLGKIPLYVGISSNCFETSVQLARRYYDLGAENFVAHPPYYYPLNADQLFRYYQNLIDSIPGNLIVYNITATTHISIPLDVIEKLSYHDRIIGAKDSERDINRLKRSVEMWKDRPDFSHFIGWGAQCGPGLLLGSDGLVPSTGNIIPEIYRELYSAALQGDKKLAGELQEKTMVVSAIYQKNRILSQSLAALKIIMNHFGWCRPDVLPPLLNLDETERQKIINQVVNTDIQISGAKHLRM